MKHIYFIVGPSRSGSSLLESRLNERLGLNAFGEIRWFFQRGFLANEICSCTKNFHDCEQWSKYNKIFTYAEANEYDVHRKYFDKFLNILPIYLKFLQTKGWKLKFQSYKKSLILLYNNLPYHSKGIIDNSKSPFYFILLKHCIGADYNIIPIIYDRESVSIVDSYSKDKIRTESHNKEMMTKKSFFHVILYLSAIRLFSYFIFKIDNSAIRVSYKELCANEVLSIKKILGEEADVLKQSNTYHSVSGNPDRVMGFKEIKYIKRAKSGKFDLVYFICLIFDRLTLFK